MGTVNIHEAKTQLSKLIEQAQAGEEVVIAKAGKPVVRLVPVVRRGRPRKPGALKGRIRIARDFNAPLPDEILKAFEGRASGK
jgi:prevent-host-death family protein